MNRTKTVETAVRLSYSRYLSSPARNTTDADHFIEDELKGKQASFYGQPAEVRKVTNAGFAGYQILGLRADGTYAHVYVTLR